MAKTGVVLLGETFDPGGILSDFAGRRHGIGALVSFTGIVRDTQGDLDALEIEHYPGMTERALAVHRDRALARWALADALIVHRHGRMAPGEPIMMVATAAAHRAPAFEAADFLMDYLKSRAPFWKREWRGDRADWVAAEARDEASLARWGQD